MISNKSTELRLPYNDALFYCQFLEGNWRLPTVEELLHIYREQNDFEENFYWCLGEEYSWVNFSTGVEGKCQRGIYWFYVRAIKEVN